MGKGLRKLYHAVPVVHVQIQAFRSRFRGGGSSEGIRAVYSAQAQGMPPYIANGTAGDCWESRRCPALWSRLYGTVTLFYWPKVDLSHHPMARRI